MTYKLPPEMAEATRLTRAGRLSEATALIQRHLRGGLRGGRPPEPKAAGAMPLIAGETVTRDASRPQPSGAASEPSDRSRATPRSGLGATLRGLAARARREAPPPSDPLPDGAAFVTGSYSNAAGTRAYRLYMPSTRTGQPMPLIVMLHGCTQSPDDFAAGTRMNAVAEELGCFVAYPAQTPSANAQKCWNWFRPDDQRRDAGEPSLIAGITRQILRDHPVDPERVYVAGLSAGGAAAAIMGAAYPDLYAAVGVHSGLPAGAARDIPSAFSAMRQGVAGNGRGAHLVPTIVFHGDQDATVHPRNGAAVAAQFTASAAELLSVVQRGQAPAGHAYSRTIHADAGGRVLCEHWVVHGAGHAWAGGSPSGSYTDPQGPDATREMLRFFLEQRRTVPGYDRRRPE